jgi:hypothetical protein
MARTTDAACQHEWVEVFGPSSGIIGWMCLWCRKWWDCTPLKPPGCK